MAKPLSVLYVSSEVYPFAKVGGLADVSYSLTLALRDLGHDIRVALPKYGSISERKNRIHEINRLRDIPIRIGEKVELATVKSSSINNPRTKVQAYITTNQHYYDNKKGIYSDPLTGQEYADNDERFIFFNRSVIETCLLLSWFPDIIHCNDWYSSLIPVYARAMFPNKFRKTKIMLTIHNFSKQGIYPRETFAKTGLPKDAESKCIHRDRFNFLKGAIYYADYINTVSPTYAQEILQDGDYGNGLNQMLIERSEKFTGISNGIDVWGWNPRTDPNIPYKLENDFDEYKISNKKALLKSFGMPYNEEVPVVAIIAHLDNHEGIQLFIDSIDKIFKQKVQVILLADGKNEYSVKLEKFTKRYAGQLGLKIAFDDALAHLAEAGSDIYLAAPLHEPSALNVRYSQTYGTVPVARATGALLDNVIEFNPETKTGNGFVFTAYNTEDLLKGLKKAVDTYRDKELWSALVKNCMETDTSWDKPVRQYDEIYRNLMKD